jgi:hydroxyquinol 1,2-dioxygenase
MSVPRTPPADITAAAIASFDGCADERLRTIMQSLTRHLHAFAIDVGLTEEEWAKAVAVLTATGNITDDRRQEFILWSDALGLSMLVDALANPLPAAATESTVLGPFYVPGAPLREYGASLAEVDAGEPVWVHGRLLDTDGRPLPDGELDVWQNGEDELYGIQNPDAPDEHLRGRFKVREDGSFAFLAVRPVPYAIPSDGPVGAMLEATGRHPWRPAHIHVIARAPGHRTLATHLFDALSEYLETDAVFAVKPSLLRNLVPHEPGDPGAPPGIDRRWFSLESDIVLARDEDAREPSDPGRTA